MVQDRDKLQWKTNKKSCMAIKWYDCQWLWVRLKVTFAVLNLCNTHNSGNIECFVYSVFTHKLKNTLAFDLNFIVKGEGLLKVTGSHICLKSGNISEMVLDNNKKWNSYMAYLIAPIVMTLSVLEGNSAIASLFKCDISYLWHIMRSLSLCICRVFCPFLNPSVAELVMFSVLLYLSGKRYLFCPHS